MSTDFELAVAGVAGDAEKAIADAMALSSGGGFLPRLQVCNGNSDMGKSGQVRVNNLGIAFDKSRFEDLGKSVDIILIKFRTKALDMSGPTVLSYYDVTSDGFKTTMRKAEVRDSQCMYGPEFLIWVPNAGEEGLFASFFLGSVSVRREFPGFLAGMRKGDDGIYRPGVITVNVKIAENKKKQSWPIPIPVPCSAPLDSFNLPSPEDAAKQVEKFLNEKASAVEVVDEAASPQRAR